MLEDQRPNSNSIWTTRSKYPRVYVHVCLGWSKSSCFPFFMSLEWIKQQCTIVPRVFFLLCRASNFPEYITSFLDNFCHSSIRIDKKKVGIRTLSTIVYKYLPFSVTCCTAIGDVCSLLLSNGIHPVGTFNRRSAMQIGKIDRKLWSIGDTTNGWMQSHEYRMECV